MKSITAPILATLAVLYSLLVLISANPTPQPSTSQDRTSDVSSGLLEAMVLHRQQQSSGTASSAATPKANRIMKVQQALKNDGFYSGPVDGVPSQSTRHAIRSFQQAKHLEVTGRIDDRTARELGVE
jgi:peptidoglycan hydrolase-like protein with peptidoglycan-binding domain